MAMVVTGNLIGAGILALPVKTGLSGLLPSLAGIAATWLMMLSTALILSRQKSLTESETADMPSFFQQELGTAGKWISVVANLIILYGLLVAYLSGAGAVLHGLFGRESSMTLWMVAFFLPATGLTLFGTRIMARGTTVFMILMWLAFLVMAAATLGRADVANYGWMDWRFLPTALPVAVTAFHFHNIIPTICRNLEHDRAAISRAMFLGTLIGLVMNVVWVVAVIGALPLEDGGHSLLSAFQRNLPATVPLQKILNSPTFTLSASLFALLAITTSYMANGTALSSFLRDLCANAPGIGGRGVRRAPGLRSAAGRGPGGAEHLPVRPGRGGRRGHRSHLRHPSRGAFDQARFSPSQTLGLGSGGRLRLCPALRTGAGGRTSAHPAGGGALELPSSQITDAARCRLRRKGIEMCNFPSND